MNRVDIVGRLTAEPKINAAGQTTVAHFNVACDRQFKKEGQPTADFIPCIAFGKTCDFIEKYFHKGMRMGASGRIQTGSYTNKDGQTVYTTEVLVENVEFVDSKKSDGSTASDSWMNAGTDEEAVFN